MKVIRLYILIFSLFLLSLPSASALAGMSQAGSETYYTTEEILSFSKKVEKTLAQKGARVAIIARVGSSRSNLPPGIRFTHTAVAVYSQITTEDNRVVPGYAIYNLYQKEQSPDVSELVQDFPVDFFAGVEVLEAGVIIPTAELQRRLLTIISSSSYNNLHNPNYSLIANPFTTDYQNCTEFTLDLITAAIYLTDDIKAIKLNQRAYFRPQPLRVSPVKLALGSMFVADITTSDHPGSPETTTFTTIGDFLTNYNAASEVFTITLDAQDG